jgi:hypothetical protein
MPQSMTRLPIGTLLLLVPLLESIFEGRGLVIYVIYNCFTHISSNIQYMANIYWGDVKDYELQNVLVFFP